MDELCFADQDCRPLALAQLTNGPSRARRAVHGLRSAGALLVAPDLPRGFHDELELAALFLERQRVALGDAGETALWAERHVVEVDVLRCLVDAPLDQLLRLELARLGGDEAHDDGLV